MDVRNTKVLKKLRGIVRINYRNNCTTKSDKYKKAIY